MHITKKVIILSRSKLNPAQRIVIHTSADKIDYQFIDTVHPDEYEIEYFSGVAVGPVEILNLDFSDPLHGEFSVRDIADSYGEWCAVAKGTGANAESFLVFGDYFGFSPIFYAMIPGKAIVISDSFGAVTSELKLLGCDPKLDVATYSATLTNSMSLFQFPFADSTMAEQVKILPFGSALRVSLDSVSVVDRDLIAGSSEKSSFENSVDSGIDAVKQALGLIANNNDSEVVLNLSGGVDSRLILASALSANLQDDVRIRTGDPRAHTGYSRRVFERDAEISSTLVKDLNLNWFVGVDTTSYPMDFNSALSLHQGYNSNFSFNFTPSNRLTVFDTPVVALLGGGGEIVRTPTGPLMLADRLREQSIGIEGVGQWVSNQIEMPEDLRGLAAGLVQSAIETISGDTLEERLVGHYLRTRNRTHFGQARSWSSRNDLPIHLLANPFFHRASMELSFEERRDGELVRVLFERLAPELLKYPFEGEFATNSLCTEPTKPILESSHWVRQFNDLKAKRSKSKNSKFDGMVGDKGKYNFSPNQASLNYATMALSFISESIETESLQMIEPLNQALLRQMRRGRMPMTQAAAKVASAVDIFSPNVSGGTRVLLYTSDVQKIRARANLTVRPGLQLSTKPLFGVDRVFEMNPSIQQVDSRILIKALPKNFAPQGMEFAFYLIREGTRVQTQWYTPQQFVEFEESFEPGSYSGIVFARLLGNDKVQFQAETSAIQIR